MNFLPRKTKEILKHLTKLENLSTQYTWWHGKKQVVDARQCQSMQHLVCLLWAFSSKPHSVPRKTECLVTCPFLHQKIL